MENFKKTYNVLIKPSVKHMTREEKRAKERDITKQAKEVIEPTKHNYKLTKESFGENIDIARAFR